MDDEDEWEYEENISFAPASWSWRTFGCKSFAAVAEAMRVGALWVESISVQMGCSNQRWRDEQQKADVKAECDRMLAQLAEL